MRLKAALFFALLIFLSSSFTLVSATGRHDQKQGSAKPGSAEKDKKSSKDKEKPYADLIKDKVKIEGLFTFYRDTIDNTLLMAIDTNQFNHIYMCGESRIKAEGAFFDNGSMGRTFPFYLKRVGKKIMFLEKNLRIRADSSLPIEKAVESGISDALIASTAIKSKPEDETGSILIDPTSFFVRDASNASYFLGQRARTGLRFDSKNSYFGEVKSFPENTEISVQLHYKTQKPQSATTLQNSYSFFHTYHFSLSSFPESDYVPRLADERVGQFLTIFQDYSSLDQETPYVRYIERWNLKKQNPDASISEPVKPIVYWVENTTPEEYRDAIAEGIEFWNPAFEKAGIRRAIVAKQMPDTADWDPADVRYSTVQWMVQPGGGYAVGPHRSNPFTGEIFDADIRISADFIRFMFNNVSMWVAPVAYDGTNPMGDNLFYPESYQKPLDEAEFDPYACNYAAESALDAAFGLTQALASSGDMADKDKITREYVHSYLVELVAHEVGHTLGLRHNFKASTIHTLSELSDRDFTKKYGLTGSVMDYGPPNIPLEGDPQGEFYASVPGPYDNWVIEYSYKDFGASSPEDEVEELKKIASRSGEANLVYATDEDAFGRSVKSIDPLVNLHDLGNEPLEFAQHWVTLSKKLWHESIKDFETDGQRYQKIYSVFQRGWRSFRTAAQIAPKYVGGLYHSRTRIGDPNGKLPFEPVPASKQREAIKFLSDNIFAPDAFDIPVDLANMLQRENLEDFSFSAYSVSQVDFPLHQAVLSIQNMALRNLYSPYILGRLLNNLERVPDNQDKYTMYDMFNDLRRSIWTELANGQNVNSFRRQLQMSHLNRMTSIYLGKPGMLPTDAQTLASNDLSVIRSAAEKLVGSSSIDAMTRAHYREVIRQIRATQQAERSFQ